MEIDLSCEPGVTLPGRDAAIIFEGPFTKASAAVCRVESETSGPNTKELLELSIMDALCDLPANLAFILCIVLGRLTKSPEVDLGLSFCVLGFSTGRPMLVRKGVGGPFMLAAL